MNDSSLTVGRQSFWGILSSDWFRFQTRHYSLKDFGRIGKWPNVEIIIYQEDVARSLKRSVRWQAYADLKIYPQDAYSHIFGLTFLAFELLNKMNGSVKPPIDKELIMKICMTHNISLGLGLSDLAYADKNITRDLEEYFCYQEFIAKLYDPEEKILVEKIYLLQFCLGEIDQFPPEAQIIMQELKKEYWQEALLFRFLEEFDYLLYAEEQYVRFGVINLLEKMVTVHLPIINNLVEQLPYLERVWTQTANDYFSQFISA
jgi:hypothetical protein